MSAQVTEIFPNSQIEAKKNSKRKISEMNQRGGGRGRGGRGGRRRFQRRRGRGGQGNQGDPAANFDTFNGINARDVTRDFNDGDWNNLGAYGHACKSHTPT